MMVVDSRLVALTFRLSPRYRLLLLSRTPPSLREATERLAADRDLCGLLYPHGQDRLPIKAVNQHAWNVLTAFRSPTPGLGLPGCKPSEEYAQFLKKQVIDGVLEVMVDGRFQTGVDVVKRLLPLKRPSASRNEIQRLSERAIELAYLSGVEEAGELSGFLYFYNRIPVSPKWRQRFPDEAALLRFLGMKPDGSWTGMPRNITPVSGEWGRYRPSHPSSFWRQWRFRNAPLRNSRRTPTYKVYISPSVDAMPATLRNALGMLAGSGAFVVKIGKDARALLRPDKIVAHFARRKDAEAFAGRAASTLAGTPSHGVPFTCQIGTHGLVSLGVDPPYIRQVFEWQEGASWRVWVVQRLARAIINARKEGLADPMPGIFMAVEASGIHPDRWMPTSARWDFEA